MYLIAGLGNPTPKYEKTRHNMGFDCVDILAEKYKIALKKSRFRALVGKGEIGGKQVLLVKPLTFMNLSGEAVRKIANYYKIDTKKELVVIYDDTDLAIGAIRLKAKGSAGSHNGMKSIVENLGSEQFCRVRVGIGKRAENADMVDFVLGRFAPADRKEIDKALERAAESVVDIISNGIDCAMNDFNGNSKNNS